MGYAGYIAELKVCRSASRVAVEIDEEQNAALLWDTTRCERRFDRKTGSFRQPTEAEVERIVALRADRLCLIAHRLVRRLFPAIQVVAKVLIDRKQLSSSEVEAIVVSLISARQFRAPSPSLRPTK